MLMQLPEAAKIVLLDMYNHLLINNKIPEEWTETIIIPILNPGKDVSLAVTLFWSQKYKKHLPTNTSLLFHST
jgi:hypothetical protein